MRDAVGHTPMVAARAQPGKSPISPMHDPTRRHAQARYDAGERRAPGNRSASRTATCAAGGDGSSAGRDAAPPELAGAA